MDLSMIRSSWKCSEAAKEASSTFHTNRTVVTSDKDVMQRSYKSRVRPQLEYYALAWSHCQKLDMENNDNEKNL